MCGGGGGRSGEAEVVVRRRRSFAEGGRSRKAVVHGRQSFMKGGRSWDALGDGDNNRTEQVGGACSKEKRRSGQVVGGSVWWREAARTSKEKAGVTDLL